MAETNTLKKFPQELLNVVAEIAAKAGVAAYKEEMKKAEKRRESERIKEIKRLLGGYRRIKSDLANEKEFTEEEKSEYRWKFVEDLMGNANGITSKSERIIKDKEKRRQENLYSIWRIDNALKLYEEECNKTSREEDKRRYREIYEMYIADEPMDVKQLAESENISEKTVYRDIGISYKILAIYLFGI